MKLTRRQLRRIILNEVRLLNEGEARFKSKVIDSEDDHPLFEPGSLGVPTMKGDPRLPLPPVVSPEEQAIFDDLREKDAARLNSPAYKFEQFLKDYSRRSKEAFDNMSTLETIMHYALGYQPTDMPKRVRELFGLSAKQKEFVKRNAKAINDDPIGFFFGKKDHAAVKKALETYGKK